MNILLLSPLPPPAGGIATWTKLFLNSKIVAMHTINLVDTSYTGKRLENSNHYYYFDEVRRFFRICKNSLAYSKNQKIDILHLNSSCSAFGLLKDVLLICLLKNFKNKKKIFIQYHCDVSKMSKNKLPQYLCKQLSYKADRIFVLNKQSQKYLMRQHHISSIFLPNFLDDNIIDKCLTCKKVISNEIREICFVGHVSKAKGIDVLYKLAKQMQHIHFTLAGKVMEEIASLKIPNNITLKGEVDREQVYQVLQEADVFLFLSKSEGFPLALLEAMAHGLPIVGTAVGAIPDMIEQSGGILVNGRCLDDVIHAIRDLNSVKKRKCMSSWNQEKVKREYSQSIVMEKIFDEYRK